MNRLTYGILVGIVPVIVLFNFQSKININKILVFSTVFPYNKIMYWSSVFIRSANCRVWSCTPCLSASSSSCWWWKLQGNQRSQRESQRVNQRESRSQNLNPSLRIFSWNTPKKEGVCMGQHFNNQYFFNWYITQQTQDVKLNLD